jgi:hypothetical protein
MALEKPRVPHMTLMHEALASQEGAGPAPIGQVWWDDIPHLAGRPEVDTIIEKWDSGTAVVLLEGYSASGKSCVAAMVGRRSAESGSRLLPAFVYYLNLTTRRGWMGPGRDSVAQAIGQALQSASRLPGFRVHFIVEDVHHEFQDLDARLQRFAKCPCARVLLTSRPLERYELGEPGSEDALSTRRHDAFVWLRDGRLEPLATDSLVVERIVKARGGTFRDLGEVLRFVGRKEPNLLLLSLVIGAAKEKGKLVDDVSHEDIREGLQDHWADAARFTGVSEAAALQCLQPLCVLSEYEVPVSRSFVEKVSGGNVDDVCRALDALATAREIAKAITTAPEPSEWCVLPHARLARAHRRVFVSDERRVHILGQYLAAEPFIGTLAHRLASEDRECFNRLVARKAGTVVQRSLARLSTRELQRWVWALQRNAAEMAGLVIETHREQLLRHELADTSLADIGWLLSVLGRASPLLAGEVAEKHAEQILGAIQAEVSLSEIRLFLSRVAKASKPVAGNLAERGQEHVLARSLAGVSLEEQGLFLYGLAMASEPLARATAERHAAEIGRSLAEASLASLALFLSRATNASGALGRDVAERQATAIGAKIAAASWQDLGLFLCHLRKRCRRAAGEVADRYRQEILGRTLREASLEDLGLFLSRVAYASGPLGQEVAEKHREEIVTRGLGQTPLRDLGLFLSRVARACPALAQEVAETHRDQILARDLAGASLKATGFFMSGVARASRVLAREVAREHGQHIVTWNLRGESVHHLSLFLSQVAEACPALAQEVAERQREDILALSLAGASLQVAAFFLSGVARASEPLAQRIAQRDAAAIRQAYSTASPRHRYHFRSTLPDWLLNLLELPRD